MQGMSRPQRGSPNAKRGWYWLCDWQTVPDHVLSKAMRKGGYWRTLMSVAAICAIVAICDVCLPQIKIVCQSNHKCNNVGQYERKSLQFTFVKSVF